MAADRPGTSGSSLMVLVCWLRSVEIFRPLPSDKLVSQTSRLGIPPALPTVEAQRSSATKSPDHTTSFHFKRRKRSGTLARASAAGLPVRCVGLARQSIVMVRFSPLLPMASTGHPSMASLIIGKLASYSRQNSQTPVRGNSKSWRLFNAPALN